MIENFVLAASAMKVTPQDVIAMTDKEAAKKFAEIRWHTNAGEPYCPKCFCLDVYKYRSRSLFKCKNCGRQFTVTSGTIFACHKMPLRSYLMAISLFWHDKISALKMSEKMKTDYRTAYELSQKMRATLTNPESCRLPSTTVEERANERCKRCNSSRKELSRFWDTLGITGVTFNHGYCPKCYRLRLAYKQDEGLCELHELTQTLKKEMRNDEHK